MILAYDNETAIVTVTGSNGPKIRGDVRLLLLHDLFAEVSRQDD